MAVFYRTNAQSLPLETSMKFSGIPYKVVGGAKFYDRKEIKDILAYVRVLANPDDEVSARRIVNVPKRGIGDTSVARMAAWAQTEGLTFSAAIDRAAEAGLTGKALKGAEALAKTLAELRPLVQTVNPADFVQLVADRTGYLAELVAEHTHEADGRIENLAELATQAGDFDDVMGFLETVALVADSDEIDSDGTRVSLMTLHTAKGLEYPAVFVVGLEEGIFPHFRSLSEPSELEEERRLFYVGITRARQHLAISHAWSRTTWGRTQPAMPSRFVTEVPSHLVDDVGLGSPRRGTGYDDERLEGATFSPAIPLADRRRVAASTGGPSGSPRHGSRGSTGAEDLGLDAGRRGGARPLGPGGRGGDQGRRGAGPGHGRLRHGGQEEPAAVGHAVAPSLNDRRRAVARQRWSGASLFRCAILPSCAVSGVEPSPVSGLRNEHSVRPALGEACGDASAERSTGVRRSRGRRPRLHAGRCGPNPPNPDLLGDFRLFAVVKSWMDEDIIEATVRNAFAQGVERVYVIDNGSDDETVARAEAAGAVIAEVYHTKQFNPRLAQVLINGVVARESLRCGERYIWWLHLDSDEFPEGPDGLTVREYLATLDRRFRIVGAEFLNHLPSGKPEYLTRIPSARLSTSLLRLPPAVDADLRHRDPLEASPPALRRRRAFHPLRRGCPLRHRRAPRRALGARPGHRRPSLPVPGRAALAGEAAAGARPRRIESAADPSLDRFQRPDAVTRRRLRPALGRGRDDGWPDDRRRGHRDVGGRR